LGYFQRAEAFRSVPGDHVLVRRITGGGAIYHTNEITFALTADADLLPSNVPASYELIHRAVATALEQSGIATRMAGSQHHGGRCDASAWCFRDPCGADLVSLAGVKILGSAQRRLQRPLQRILHQGSLIVPPDVRKAQLVNALIVQLSRVLELCAASGDVASREQALAETLSSEKYQNPRFTWRR